MMEHYSEKPWLTRIRSLDWRFGTLWGDNAHGMVIISKHYAIARLSDIPRYVTLITVDISYVLQRILLSYRLNNLHNVFCCYLYEMYNGIIRFLYFIEL